jgi:hypothetical protein
MEDPGKAIQQALYGDVERKYEHRRKIKIISWLLPRFYKGISDPKDYEELIGRVDEK